MWSAAGNNTGKIGHLQKSGDRKSSVIPTTIGRMLAFDVQGQGLSFELARYRSETFD